MGRVLQKKKNRSSTPKQKPKRTGQLKSGKKKINVLGNAIIAQNWDRKLTLTQNYRRLGLVHKLNAPTGGSEKRPTKDGGIEEVPEDSLHVRGSAKESAKKAAMGETRVERDPETGKIIRVIRDEEEIEVGGRKIKRSNPLNDPLNDLSEDEEAGTASQRANAKSAIVQQLERQAAQEGRAVKAKKPRHQSQREEEWIKKLIERHGENYSAMARDRKLNPMQQSEGDLKRRIRKWKASHS
ncbi:Nucleolar protein 16 [Aspergillus turcosus]|uniref:Nucleolar protein 16 n=1 Tax=Aspergillus turcosus TaxID=1245748 RepID=A0A229YXK0_9EURO|nr:Nucleolar protein 16 [Aspergillus turcosus]RLL97401.1 Nucleolar protein 16 [Aspergillus turcosus]